MLGLYIGKGFTAKKATPFAFVNLEAAPNAPPQAVLDHIPDFINVPSIHLVDGSKIINLRDRIIDKLYVLEGLIHYDPGNIMPQIVRPIPFAAKKIHTVIEISKVVDEIMKLKNMVEEKKDDAVFQKEIAPLSFELKMLSISNIDEFDEFMREAYTELGGSRINNLVNVLVLTVVKNMWISITLPHIFSYLYEKLSTEEISIEAAGIENNFKTPWIIVPDLPKEALIRTSFLDSISLINQRYRRFTMAIR